MLAILNFWTHQRLDVTSLVDLKNIAERSQRVLFVLSQSQAIQRLHETNHMGPDCFAYSKALVEKTLFIFCTEDIN